MEIMDVEVSQEQIDTLIELIETEDDYKLVLKLVRNSMPDINRATNKYLKVKDPYFDERMRHYRDEALLGMI